MATMHKNIQASTWVVLTMVVLSWVLSGCAPLLVAGGAAGGYAVAKDMDDGELIDGKKK